jgi:hypothetical protein
MGSLFSLFGVVVLNYEKENDGRESDTPGQIREGCWWEEA